MHLLRDKGVLAARLLAHGEEHGAEAQRDVPGERRQALVNEGQEVRETCERESHGDGHGSLRE